MSLRENDTDGGTWGLAMTSHGRLAWVVGTDERPVSYKTDYGMPLGNVNKIKNMILDIIEDAKMLSPTGTLPQIIEIPVEGTDLPLMVPATLGGAALLTFREALNADGVLPLDDLASIISASEGLVDYASETADYEATLEGYGDNPKEVRARIDAWHRQRGETEPTSAEMETLLRNYLNRNGVPRGEQGAYVGRAASALTAASQRQPASALTSVQNYAALATLVSSAAEVTIDSVQQQGEEIGSDALLVTTQVLTAITAVCDAVATVTAVFAGTGVGAIVSAVFEVIALVCRLINAILDWVRGYTVTAQQGWDRSWDERDCTLILKERLRFLVLMEEENLRPEKWNPAFNDVFLSLGLDSDTERAEQVGAYVEATASDAGAARIANAKAIALMVGGRACIRQLIQCEDIMNWLLFVGGDEDRCKAVYTYLYESRKVDVVRTRQTKLMNLRGNEPHGGPGYGVEYTGNMATYVGGSNCADGDHKCRELDSVLTGCQVNAEYGSQRWYKRCRNLDIAAGEWLPFSATKLDDVYQMTRRKLRVTASSLNFAPHVALTFSSFALTVPRLRALARMLAPASGDAIWNSAVPISIRTPNTNDVIYDGAIVLRNTTLTALDPIARAGAIQLTIGNENVVVWGACNQTEAWFMTARFGFMYGAFLPIDTALPHYVAQGLPAGNAGTLRSREAIIREAIYNTIGIGSSGGAGVGAGGESSGLLLAGAAVAASAAAFLLLKK